MRALSILAVSGSLRKGSTNTALLEAARLLAPPDVKIEVWKGQGALPQFSPDLETDVPAEAQAFRESVGRADGMIFAVPEYARGMPGALKNALDWLVGGETFLNVKFAQWNASPRAFEAQKSLRLVLETMSGRCIDEAALALPLIKQEVTGEALAAHPEWAPQIRAALENFTQALRA